MEKSIKILLIGGGTGGHLMPLIPLIKAIPPQWEIHLATDQKAEDLSIVRENFSGLKFKHHPLACGKIRAYKSAQNIIDLPKIVWSIFKAFQMIRRMDPDIIFFKGGYVGFPFSISLIIEQYFCSKKRKIFLHESDITPGKLTKILSPLAQKVFSNFEGFPLFYSEKKSSKGSIQKSKFPTILIVGGSQGAQSLNQLIEINLPLLLREYQITLITGKEKSIKVPSHERFSQYEWQDQKTLFQSMAEADLVISRAGAGIFQGLFLQKKMLLVPLIGSARDHQQKNAEYFSQKHLAHIYTPDQDLIKALKALEKDEVLEKNLKASDFRSKEKEMVQILMK